MNRAINICLNKMNEEKKPRSKGARDIGSVRNIQRGVEAITNIVRGGEPGAEAIGSARRLLACRWLFFRFEETGGDENGYGGVWGSRVKNS